MKYICPYNTIYFIYRILNLSNNKLYIGRSRNPAYRYKQHLSNSKIKHHNMKKVHKAIFSDGENNFVFEVFEQCDNYTLACEREKYWIEFYHSDKDEYGYNDKSGPRGPMWSGEDRQKISERLKGDKNPMYGKSHNSDTIQILSNLSSGINNPFFGELHSEETKQKIGLASAKRNQGANNPNAKLSPANIDQIKIEWRTGKFKKIELAKNIMLHPKQ